MDDYFKMTYLLGAFEDKAEAFAKQCKVCRESYQLVIAHLKNKNGNMKAFVDQTLHRLHMAQARSERLEDQEILCESLFSMVNQLLHKGESVDSKYLQQQLLKMLSRTIQRHTLDRISQQRRCNMHNGRALNNDKPIHNYGAQN
ncbi:hypothetical protein KIN20_010983 [Parelaphostrongylus tenuis]|uniref:Uncharacterized protein n=1 Tax=Parelaphostrongylus tenuis TaxID=148309 RepID=A0AAD5MZR1_PARTN|nr:hypothetical protein KIN20_010983 [Parelaphostrongylus tenuis]